MIAWLAANWLNLAVGLVIVGIVALCLRNLLPVGGKSSACAGCSGCGSCGGCAGCACSDRKQPQGRS